MKTAIKPYTRSLIAQNLPYIIICFVFLILTVVGPFIVVPKLTENIQKQDQLEKDIETLTARKNILASLRGQSDVELTQDLSVLNSLVPDAEDYFSVIEALDEISKKTNFQILSYNIATSKDAAAEKLPLQITGVGNTQAFINFLNTYNFGGNRLITLDKVEFKPKLGESTYQLSINFYHKNVSGLPAENVDYQQTLSRLKEFKDKVRIVVKPQTPSGTTSYPTKKNPF